MQEHSEWFKLVDAAHLLGISEITLRRRLKANQIAHQLRFGKYLVLLKKHPSTGQWNTNSFQQSESQLQELRTLAKPNGNADLPIMENNTRISKCEQEISQLKRQLADQETLIQFLEQSMEAFFHTATTKK
jgi:hypothetical protein